MKKAKSPVVIVLGIVGGGLCLCCGGGAAFMGLGWQKMTAARDDAFAWAEPALKAMSKDWQLETTTPYLYRTDLAGELVSYREKFGQLKSLSPPTGFFVSARANAGEPAHTDARLYCSGTFDKGSGDVRMVVRKENDKYKVLDLEVVTPGAQGRKLEGED